MGVVGRENEQKKSPEDWPVMFSGLPFLRLRKSGEYHVTLPEGVRVVGRFYVSFCVFWLVCLVKEVLNKIFHLT